MTCMLIWVSTMDLWTAHLCAAAAAAAPSSLASVGDSEGAISFMLAANLSNDVSKLSEGSTTPVVDFMVTFVLKLVCF